MADWASLPAELVRRIAHCLLYSNDLDCYMDFRAVCPNWRSATDDPNNSTKLRFRPFRWIVVDEVSETHSRLLINTFSGRVIRKDLPLLSKYFVVAATLGGFFVLANKEPPHPAVVLTPFTGHMIRYKAAVPSYVDISGAALSGPFTGNCYEQYKAVPDSDSFALDFDDEEWGRTFVSMRLAVASGMCAFDNWQTTVAVPPLPLSLVPKISYLMRLYAIDPDKMFSDKPVTAFADLPGTGDANHLFLVASDDGEVFAIIKLQQHLKVFWLDNDNRSEEVEPVKSIGDRAIFIGYRRCISVSANKFLSIVANSAYYVKSTDSSLAIYKYDLEEEKEERVSEAIDSLNQGRLSFAKPPFTIVQLLSSYTVNVRESQLLEMEKLKRQQLPSVPVVRGH
uniref:KIB1-4 beta-propeller domain-containing protein n=1 Tax=Aegilops tauschii TaxID=37682 RepID=M8BVU8_AEGTA